MRGVVAGGSGTTVRAGAEILARGGNAVDAAVAACFATAAGEPTLTSLAGGGVLLVREAATGTVTICDFFADAPGLEGGGGPALDFFGVDLDFGPAIQTFHIGAGAAAVPGNIPGLCSALERWGSLPLAEVVAPACHFLRAGVPLEPLQARAVELLEPILFQTDAGRRQFGRAGRLLRAGEPYRLPQLADTLEELAAGDWRRGYRRCVEEPILEQFGAARGGRIGRADLEQYRPAWRSPLRVAYRGHQVFTNPPPGAGGSMIGLMLELLQQVPLATHDPDDPAWAAALVRAMAVADEARAATSGGELLADVKRWRARYRALADGTLGTPPAPPAGRGSTTHISAIDAAGNAAAVTTSHGEGNGHLIGATGIMMNNLMGEEDLFPQGFHSLPAGARLATMMSPTLLEAPDGTLTVLGSGGANRIRSALTQVIALLVDGNLEAAAAVGFPRLHYEAGVLNAEVFGRRAGGDYLEQLGAARLLRFTEPNLFFGGTHLVQRRADGTLAGAGDPRRGGAVCTVPA